MDKKNLFRLLALILVIVLAAITHFSRPKSYKQMEIALDTVIEIQATAPQKIPLENVVNQAFQLVSQYEKKFSYYDEESQLYQMNHATDSSFPIDEDFYSFLVLARQVYAQTDSLYDISIGVLSELWDFENQTIPDSAQINNALANIGFQKLQFDNNVLTRPEGLKINFGSIAKGFILDKVADFLKQNGVSSAVINAGGDIQIFGQKKALKIGVKHPRSENNDIIQILSLQNMAVVTSGDYERFFIINGQRYHHIINPKTGFPGTTMTSISTLHPSAFIADAYSTGLFLLPPQKAIQIADSVPDLEVILFYEENGELKKMQSSGMKTYAK
jgi:thiamine biosynthesis lipoprotein